MDKEEFVVVIGRIQPIGDTSNKEAVRLGCLLREDGTPVCQKVKLERI